MTSIKKISPPAKLLRPIGSDPPLAVGRERELSELCAGLEEAAVGRGRLFLISGEVGIGKTRLADELAVEANSRATRVAAGGDPCTQRPFKRKIRRTVFCSRSV